MSSEASGSGKSKKSTGSGKQTTSAAPPKASNTGESDIDVISSVVNCIVYAVAARMSTEDNLELLEELELYQRECWDRQIAREQAMEEAARLFEKERQEKLVRAQQLRQAKMKEREESVKEEYAARKRELELQSRKYAELLHQPRRSESPIISSSASRRSNSSPAPDRRPSLPSFVRAPSVMNEDEDEFGPLPSTSALYVGLPPQAQDQQDGRPGLPRSRSLRGLSPPPPRPFELYPPPSVSGGGFSFGPQFPLPVSEGGSSLDEMVAKRLQEMQFCVMDTVKQERRLSKKGTKPSNSPTVNTFSDKTTTTIATVIIPTAPKEKKKPVSAKPKLKKVTKKTTKSK